MTPPDGPALFAALAATWPAAEEVHEGPLTLRRGDGGSRVSAATFDGELDMLHLDTAARTMRGWGQTPLFMVRAGQDALDARLAQAGYSVKDPTVFYSAPIAKQTQQRPPPVTTFTAWPPLTVQHEIWQSGGVGPNRRAVMDRAVGPKVTHLGRLDDRPAGTCFTAISGEIAMLHALEILPAFRRRGLARYLLTAAAFWAASKGARWFALAVTEGNAGANALYQGLGMTRAGGYHYRRLAKDT